jgi:hypothetical protein
MTVMDYQTRDGLADYGFSIEFRPDIGWRVYVVFLPISESCDGATLLPYQSVDPDGRRYIDWAGKITSLGDAKTVAALWAELIQRYQASHERKSNRNEITNEPWRIKQLMTDAA